MDAMIGMLFQQLMSLSSSSLPSAKYNVYIFQIPTCSFFILSELSGGNGKKFLCRGGDGGRMKDKVSDVLTLYIALLLKGMSFEILHFPN